MVSTKLSDKGTGVSFNFGHKLDNELFFPIKLDGGLFKNVSGEKADFLIYYKKLGTDKTKIVILELKSSAKKEKAIDQIENTIKTIRENFRFMLPDNYEILKVVKFNKKSPKQNKRSGILYIREDEAIAKLLRK
jgi:hypothetical protein